MKLFKKTITEKTNSSKRLIINEIKKYEWDNVDDVISSILPNIIFSVSGEKSDEDLLTSRFGGRPAVTNEFNWPVQSLGQKAPLAFFFQLNFEEIKPFDTQNVFPSKGVLLCFASVTDDIMWEHDVKDAFITCFFPNPDDLKFADVPALIPNSQQLETRKIQFKSSFQLPLYPFNFELNNSDSVSEDDLDGMDEVALQMMDEGIGVQMRIKMGAKAGLNVPEPKNKFHTLFSHNLILGVPFSVQHNIPEEWAEKHHEDEDKRANYINVISFEMIAGDGYGFSNNGAHLYLCIDKDDLEKEDFSKITTFVQNT